MGSCFSKKKVSSSPTTVKSPIEKNEATIRVEEKKLEKIEEISTAAPKKEKEEESVLPKKEVFVIKHRKSHDRERTTAATTPSPPKIGENENVVEIAGVRASSCTKEEVDAILIQCGRLSRSNSSGKAISSASGRKYSGSKRSFDFDNPDNESDPVNADLELKRKDEEDAAERRQHRQRNRQSPSKGRRRTPSREREQQQRSGSRERSGSTGNGRRVSRSPARRSENSNSQPAAPNSANNTGSRPGKMVSVPATDKTSNGGNDSGIKRITVKRNVSETAVAGSRTAASPRRSRSPARRSMTIDQRSMTNPPCQTTSARLNVKKTKMSH